MPDTKADLILHPLRMRIIMAIAGKQMTAQNLATALPDIAQATLYRHINKLAKGGVLTVVAERPVRGTLEKVYSLSESGAFLNPADIAGFSKDDHMRLFTSFVAILLGEFSQYLNANESPDFVADGVSYSKLLLHLNDEELLMIGQKMHDIVEPLLENTSAAGRKRRVFTTIVLPAPEEPDSATN